LRGLSDRILDRWVVAGVVLYGLAMSATLLLTGASASHPRELGATIAKNAASLTYDDGYYYLEIARQIANGAGSTFDGVNPTNGYHPLWLLCLVPIFWVASTPAVALIAVVLAQAVLMSLCAAWTYRVARQTMTRFGATLAAALWVHAQLPYRVALSGLEYGVYASSSIAAAYFYGRRFARGPLRPAREYFALGLALALTFLCRVDAILLAGCMGCVLAARELRRGFSADGARRMLCVGAPVAGTVLIYAGTNRWLFGHCWPISGTIKRDWSEQLLEQDPQYRAHGWMIAKICNLVWPFGSMKPTYVLFLVAGSLGAGCAWLLARVLRRRVFAPFTRAQGGPLVLFSLAQLSVYVVAYHDGYSFQRWYYVMQPWLGALLMATAADRVLRWARRSSARLAWAQRSVSLVAIGVLCAVPVTSARTAQQWRRLALSDAAGDPLYAAAADWVAAHVQQGDVVAAWNAGKLGYASGRRVINLDGLVNSWKFYEKDRLDMCGYWRRENVKYVVDVFELDREVAFIGAYYAPGASFSVCAPQLERVWVGPAYPQTSQHAEAFLLR
jgi:hypothetical protein